MAELPNCPTCKEPIAADDPVATQHGKPDVHVRCWKLTPTKVAAQEEAGAA